LRGEKKGVAASLDTRYHRSLQELVGASAHLMELTRQRKLPPDATGGSVATVTNFGTFGLAFATPIPLPEQTLVLGMGAARQEPFWDEAKGQFVPVWEALFTLSFDHRVLDGGAAGRLSAVPLRRFRIKVRAKQAATPT
jgi:pyruvate/2-oxoglutarate dehydrogenase complex dihydrolipoamide acyltransferase (E2) component